MAQVKTSKKHLITALLMNLVFFAILETALIIGDSIAEGGLNIIYNIRYLMICIFILIYAVFLAKKEIKIVWPAVFFACTLVVFFTVQTLAIGNTRWYTFWDIAVPFVKPFVVLTAICTAALYGFSVYFKKRTEQDKAEETNKM